MPAKVMVPGRVSLRTTVVAVAGPLFTTLMVYATSESGAAVEGPFLVTLTSASFDGVEVTAVDASFSGFGAVAQLMVAGLGKKVEGGVAGAMCTVRVKSALLPDVMVATVQVTEPLLPAPGSLQLNVGPLFCASETNVMPAGRASLSVAMAESSGPRLTRKMSYATSVSAAAVVGPLFVTDRSDDCARAGREVRDAATI